MGGLFGVPVIKVGFLSCHNKLKKHRLPFLLK